MCIAILKPKNIEIPEKNLKQSFYANPDGAGFGFFIDEKPYIYKGYFTYESFIKVWHSINKIYDLKSKDVIIHFRIASCGKICVENTHPFLSNKNSIVAHNGTIRGMGNKLDGYIMENDMSDTRKFINEYINNLPVDFWKYKVLKDLVEYRVNNSKLIILTFDKWYIINEADGVWDKGVWYSNYSYKDTRSQYAQLWLNYNRNLAKRR